MNFFFNFSSKEFEKTKALDEEVYRLKDAIKDLKKSLNEQYDKLQSNDSIAKNNDRKHEHILNEARKRNQSLEEKLQHFEKQIVSLPIPINNARVLCSEFSTGG